MTQEINDSDFQKEVLDAKEPVLVDFWAEWCGPCKMLGPVIGQLAEEMKGTVKIVKMNVDDNPQTPSEFGIRSIPTLMLFKGGKEVASKVGAAPKNKLQEWINSNI